MRWKIFSLFLFIFSIISTSAICTVTFDSNNYIAGETVTAAMMCDSQQEKNDGYELNWTYQNGTLVKRDTGTTPLTVSENFYQSYSIPSSWPEGVFINATLSGTDEDDLEGSDFANVSSLASSSNVTLIVSSSTFGGGYLGLVSSIKATILDENGKKISGGSCEVSALSNDEEKILLESKTYPINGMIEVSDILSPVRFREGTDYAYLINCYCGSSGSSRECIDEDGNLVTNSIGTTKNFFTTKSYLQVNTVVDKTNYDLRDFVTICVNITNVDYTKRIPLQINHQARCSRGNDNNDDLDRNLIFTDGLIYDQRGIDVNTTQMQCKRFIIPEVRIYEGTNSTCYASTNVWVIGDDGEKILGYATTSPQFFINNTELNLKVDWEQTGNLTFNSIINLSSDSFSGWNGTNYGNIDIALISPSEVIDSNVRKVVEGVEFSNFYLSRLVKSISVFNSTGGVVDSYLEFTDEGNLEIELRDQNLNQSGWYNVTVVFNDFDERRAEALEGIENKTGTFHLDVECPSEGLIGEDINCSITAQVEDSQIVEKEVDFTCYISNGTNNFSALNFNQMINHTSLTLYRNFSISPNFNDSTSLVLQCYADYYNFGSRRDSFYDSFTAVTEFTTPLSGSINPRKSLGRINSTDQENNSITGMATGLLEEEFPTSELNGKDSEKDLEIFRDTNPKERISKNISFLASGLILLLLGFFSYSSLRKKVGIGNAFLSSIFIIFIIGFIFAGSQILNLTGQTIPEEIEKNVSFITSNLFKGTFLTLFIVIIIGLIFKLLNVRGEIKFGREDNIFKRYEKRLTEQEKLNRKILQEELKNKKNLAKTLKKITKK